MAALVVAVTASATNVKSRVCSPSPYTPIGAPGQRRAAGTRLNPMSGRCLGP